MYKISPINDIINAPISAVSYINNTGCSSVLYISCTIIIYNLATQIITNVYMINPTKLNCPIIIVDDK